MRTTVSLRFLMTLLLASMLCLSACGTEQPLSGNTEASPPAAETGDSQAAEPQTNKGETAENNAQTRLYTDVLDREVEIPAQPERIAALWTVGELIALDLKPVGSTEHLLRFYSDEDRAGIDLVGESNKPDMERLLALEPELIVVSARATEDELEQYSKIAPTVATPFFGDPIERFRIVADLIGQPDAATAWLQAYDQEVADMREQVKPLQVQGKSALVIQFAQKAIYLYPSSTFPTIFDAYQFKLTDKQAELESAPDFAPTALSLETLSDFYPDHLFVIINDEDSEAVYEEMKQSKVWENLRAVQDKHAYLIENRLSINDVMTLDWALDEVYSLLSATGDPS